VQLYSVRRGIKVKVGPYLALHRILRTAQSALCVTPGQTSSLEHYLQFSGKYSATR